MLVWSPTSENDVYLVRRKNQNEINWTIVMEWEKGEQRNDGKLQFIDYATYAHLQYQYIIIARSQSELRSDDSFTLTIAAPINQG
jgi:hypothetical protein